MPPYHCRYCAIDTVDEPPHMLPATIRHYVIFRRFILHAGYASSEYLLRIFSRFRCYAILPFSHAAACCRRFCYACCAAVAATHTLRHLPLICLRLPLLFADIDTPMMLASLIHMFYYYAGAAADIRQPPFSAIR